jgi:hypothetical protein
MGGTNPYRKTGRKLNRQPRRERRDQVRALQPSFKNLTENSPIPLLLLTAEQWNHLEPHSCLVHLKDMTHKEDQKFLCLSYDVLWVGPQFSESASAVIVLDANRIDMDGLLKDHPYRTRNILGPRQQTSRMERLHLHVGIACIPQEGSHVCRSTWILCK